MKLKVNKEAILESLQHVQSVISTRHPMPVLQNVLFHADKDVLWLSATDLEMSVRTGVEAEILHTGSTTLPAKRIFSIFRELPASEIQLETDDREVTTIQCGSSLFKINGISEEDFPPLPHFEGSHTYAVDQGTLKEMLRSTSYAALPDEARQLLHGIFLSFRDGKLSVVATDGRRMALMEHEVEFPKESEADFVVPPKTVSELMRTLGGEGAVRIQTTSNQIAFEFGRMTVISKLIEGTYPNYRQVIPAGSEERIVLERETFLTAIRRVALLASDAANSVCLKFVKNKVEITAQTPEIGEAHEAVTINYAGKPIQIAFNADFLMDPLKNLVADEVVFELTDDHCPGVIKCNVPFLYVIMPMRLE